MFVKTQGLPVLTGRHLDHFGPGCPHCKLIDPEGRAACWACAEVLDPTLQSDHRPTNPYLADAMYDLAARSRRGERVSQNLCALIGRNSRTYGEVTKDVTPCFGQRVGRHQALVVQIAGKPVVINIHPLPIKVQALHTGAACEPTVTLERGQAASFTSDVLEILEVDGWPPQAGKRCLITF